MLKKNPVVLKCQMLALCLQALANPLGAKFPTCRSISHKTIGLVTLSSRRNGSWAAAHLMTVLQDNRSLGVQR